MKKEKKPDQSLVKLEESCKALSHALSFEEKAKKDRFYFSGIAKSFETCFEYAWKYFRKCALEEGLEAFGPRESIKFAGRLGLVKDVEQWLRFLNDRNQAVHDYLGLTDEDYLKTIHEFNKEVQSLI